MRRKNVTPEFYAFLIFMGIVIVAILYGPFLLLNSSDEEKENSANCKNLEIGMTEEEMLQIMGEPKDVITHQNDTSRIKKYQYNGLQTLIYVVVDKTGEVVRVQCHYDD